LKTRFWLIALILAGVVLVAYANWGMPLYRDVIDITSRVRRLNKALLVEEGVRHPSTDLYVKGPGMAKLVRLRSMDSSGRFSFADCAWSKDGSVIACLVSAKSQNDALLYGFAFDFDAKTAYEPTWQSAGVVSFPPAIEDLLNARGGAVRLNIDIKSGIPRTRRAWFWEFW
jgi:hypothetical protein